MGINKKEFMDLTTQMWESNFRTYIEERIDREVDNAVRAEVHRVIEGEIGRILRGRIRKYVEESVTVTVGVK